MKRDVEDDCCMIRSRMLISALYLWTLPLAMGGCQAILDLPAKIGARQWCLDAEPAKGRAASDDFINAILHPDTNTHAPELPIHAPIPRSIHPAIRAQSVNRRHG